MKTTFSIASPVAAEAIGRPAPDQGGRVGQSPAPVLPATARRRAILVGNPNVGKSVLFGRLTGTYVTVSNYPGTTVEITRARAALGGAVAGGAAGGDARRQGSPVDETDPWELLDTPGTNNLVPMSDDEAVTRSILIRERHDAIVQVGDAKSLSRALLLTLQLAETGLPFLLVLNMADELRARGLALDVTRLGELLSVPTCAISALRDEGVDALRGSIAAHADPATHARARRADVAPTREPPDEVGAVPDGEGFSAIGRSEETDATEEIDDQDDPVSGVHRAVPHPCAPRFPPDIEAAIEELEPIVVDAPGIAVAPRAIATLLLGGDDALCRELGPRSDEILQRVRVLRAEISARHGHPAFAVMTRARLQAAQAIVREVQRRATATELAGDRLPTRRIAGVAALLGAFAALVADGAFTRTVDPATALITDPLADYGVRAVVGRVLSSSLWHGWGTPSIVFGAIVAGLGAIVAGRAGRVRSVLWKGAGAWCSGFLAYSLSAFAEVVVRRHVSVASVVVGCVGVVGALAWWAFAAGGERRDVGAARWFGRVTMRPLAGLPFLAASLFLAYKVVGVFGAGTAVDFLEKDVFGSTVAQAKLDVGPVATARDDATDGAIRLRVVPVARPASGGLAPAGGAGVEVVAEVRTSGVFVEDPNARVTIDGSARIGDVVARSQGHYVVRGDLAGRTARLWSGHLNRGAFAVLDRIGWSFLTSLLVGPYGLLTMGLTYAIAIVLPVVTTFFFVFSILEDSGYLPRLAVMANRGMRVIGLNGKAVLPMVLGLGCDTMATLTARVLESKKERLLTTFLLALAIPCSSQLTVIFAMMQSVSWRATMLWGCVMVATLLLVGWTAARVVPGDRSDFVLEVPPIRRPELGNLVTKTMARIEWYLREAVPLFILGAVLLFALDALNLLPFIHRAGEPVVHYALGFSRAGGVADKVSEALLVGFLRRDFGAAGLLEMARHGALTAGDVAVSMVVITLFIPCIANVFMIIKERGARVALMMAAFIFPYAIVVGALVRRIMGA